MINLTIDGRAVQVPAGTTILDAARQLDIHIPTLCWLEKVSTTGACRICAVEIAGVDRPMTSCNTPVKEGIVVTTSSEKLLRLRKQIMELILVNHPLDCPVCDAGGECELQDTCYELDVVRQEFRAEDVNPAPIDHWPLIQQVPSRCVLCERCVKVCHEVIGADALFVSSKGDRAFIDKKVENCTYCGNCVSVCPTGTMISKPFKFKARSWALNKVPSVCSYCSAQCEIDLNVQHNEVYRVTSPQQGTINEGTLCIGGFFGSGYINSCERLTSPLVEQKPASWDAAMTRMVSEIERIRKESSSSAIAGLASPRLSNEENYLFQKLFRVAVGSNNIDSEARYSNMRALRALDKGFGLKGASNSLAAIAEADTIIVFGADPAAEAPAVEWQIRKAIRKRDARLVIANMRPIQLSSMADCSLCYRPGREIALAKGLMRLLLDGHHLDLEWLQQQLSNMDEMRQELASVDLAEICRVTGLAAEQLAEAAEIIGRGQRIAVVFGADLMGSGYGLAKSAAVANLALLCGALRHGGGLYPLAEKGNMQGLLDMGVAPEYFPGYQAYDEHLPRFAKTWGRALPASGLDAEGILQEIENGRIRLLYLAACNPLAFPNSGRWLKALEKVEVLIVEDIFPSQVTRLATVVVPGCSAAEKAGTMTSLDQRVNRLQAAIKPVGESREDWEILAELYQRLRGDERKISRADVWGELESLTGLYLGAEKKASGRLFLNKTYPSLPAGECKYQLLSVCDETSGLQLLCGPSMNHFGTTSTRAAACLEVEGAAVVRINPQDAEEYGITDGGTVQLESGRGNFTGSARYDAGLPAGLLFTTTNFAETGVTRLLPDGSNRTEVKIIKK